MGVLQDFLDRFASPRATAEALIAQYFRFAYLSEPERLLKLFTTRGGWKKIDKDTLVELIERLRRDTKTPDEHLDAVITLIVVGEACQIEPVLRSSSLENAAMVLGMKADVLHAEWRAKAVDLCLRIAPDNGFLLAKRAVVYYEAGDFKTALPFFRQAFEHLESVRETVHLADHVGERAGEWRQVSAGMDEWFEALKEIHADCRNRAR